MTTTQKSRRPQPSQIEARLTDALSFNPGVCPNCVIPRGRAPMLEEDTYSDEQWILKSYLCETCGLQWVEHYRMRPKKVTIIRTEWERGRDNLD